MKCGKSVWKGGTLKQQEGEQVCTFFCRPEQRNQYSDSLGAGRSGFQCQKVRKTFSSLRPSRVALEPTQPPVKLEPGIKRRGVALTTHSYLALRLRMSRALPLLPLPPPTRRNPTIQFNVVCTVHHIAMCR